MTSGEWEKHTNAIQAAARTRRRAMTFANDPEEDLAAYHLPDWVADKLPTIEIGRPDGRHRARKHGGWIARLTREAAGEG